MRRRMSGRVGGGSVAEEVPMGVHRGTKITATFGLLRNQSRAPLALIWRSGLSLVLLRLSRASRNGQRTSPLSKRKSYRGQIGRAFLTDCSAEPGNALGSR